MMSHRGKRQALSRLDDITPVATKRRKGRASTATEEEETSPLEQRPPYSSISHISSDIKMSSIYNRSVTDAPAELFRKDLISAMKLPDSEPLTSDHYWVITDQWKQEWERGVQVPVKPDSLPGPVVRYANTNLNNSRRMLHEFKLPKNKYIRITKDEHFRVDEHYLSNVGIHAEKCCAYDLEDVDVVWLNILNGERALLGLPPINQDQLERVIEELEIRCWEKVHAIVKKEEGLALEFDESVICDVCRSPDSEDGNEMVFCDCCNICVHQACYGITSIPSGSWLCRTCALGLRPECVLCPNKNGAMKSTRSGQKWAHVSCALWIPEVSIGCVEKMEPITKISSIPQSRWALICVLCRERVGACIQCSVKTCKTAYHVTCAFKHGLEMRAIIDEESTADDDNTVKLRSYCQKHSVSCKKENSSVSGSVSDEDVKKKQRKDMTSEEKSHARAVKLQEIESEFEKHVTIKDINRKYNVDAEGLEYIYHYWVLKRRSAFNKPLISARNEDTSDLQNKNQEQVDQEKMRMFVQLRQDLERVRNLCYMVSRREKLSRTYQRLREQTFYKQAALLSDTRISLSMAEINSIKEANHGPSIYDRLYSHVNALDLSTDFETMVHRIAGRSDSELSPGHSFNGYVAGKNGKRSCFNGDYGKGSGNSGFFESMSSSASEMDTKSHGVTLDIESDTRSKVNNRMNKSQRKNSVENRTKNTARRKKKGSPLSVSNLYSTSSSDDDDESSGKKSGSKSLSPRPKKNTTPASLTSTDKQSTSTNNTLDPLQRRLSSRSASISAAEEDEDDDDSENELKLLRRKTKSGGFRKNAASKIYSSDSDSSSSSASNSDVEEEIKSADSKQVRTKASMKEFSAADVGASVHHRTPKDRVGSNGINKSVSFLSSSSATSTSKNANVAATEKRRRVDKLFNEESDDEISRRNILQDDSDSDVFMQQRKSTKLISNTGKSRKNEVRERKNKSPSIESISKKNTARKDCAKDDVFSFDSSVSVEKTNNNHGSSSNYDMLTLVPQRAAAKKAIKAIEHIKNGMVKPTTVFEDTEEASKGFKAAKILTVPSKKELHPQQLMTIGKHKTSGDDDAMKMSSVDKRTLLKSSSSLSLTTTTSSSSAGSSKSHISVTSSLTITATTVSSSSLNSATSQFAPNPSTSSTVATASPTEMIPLVSVDKPVCKKSPTPSSSSSSYSSSSSSSSSSDSSSSGGSSSSSNSSSSSGSSSSSSESEGEDDIKPNLLGSKSAASLSIATSISASVTTAVTATSICKTSEPEIRTTPESNEQGIIAVKCEADLGNSENKDNSTSSSEINVSYKDDREECKPLVLSKHDRVLSSEQKSLSTLQSEPLLSPAVEILKENYTHSVDDHSSVTETKAAIENLTNDEQNFLSSVWDSTTTTTTLSTPACVVANSVAAVTERNNLINMVIDNEEDENVSDKHDCSLPILPSLPNRSLFSPQLMKDIDLSPFDDMNENNNLTDGQNVSLASLVALTFDGNFPFKEDSKEDSARETKNLVEKLKLEMARKKNSSGDSLDLMGSAPTPDVMLNHMDDIEDVEPSSEIMVGDKMEVTNQTKKDDSLSSDNYSQLPHQEEQPQNQPPQSLMDISSDTSLLLSESDPSLKMTPSMATQAFADHSDDAVILPKDSHPVPWPSSDRRFDDGAQSSPYTQDLANAPDRWSESVMLPSRRSDCSSASVSSRSSSSSTYSETPNVQTSHNDDVGVSRLEPSLELPQHSVSDLLRPTADNIFAAAAAGGSVPENMYQYDDHHLSFIKSAFNPANQTSPDNKSLYTHGVGASHPLTQSPSSLFPASSMSNYDSVTAFTNSSSLINNTFSQPLSIQTPIVATASFTTTSQNMAIITSIISPVAPPPLHSDETPTAATPVSTESVTFEDKSANSSTSDASCAAMPSIEKSVIEEEVPLTPPQPLPALQQQPSQPLPAPAQQEPVTTQFSPENDAYSSAEKEKENIFTNVADIANNASSAVPAPVTTTTKEPSTNVPLVVAKSPAPTGVSPARLETVVTKSRTREPSTRKNNRNANKSTPNRRGRGRGRGRGRSRNPNRFYRELDDDIQSKLVGTVYDFDDDDDELTGDNFTNLKAMRERRKSTDTAYCDRFSTSSKDTCYSPKFASPSSQHQPPSSKRKSSVASTPDRRSSHRSQLSPLCEIGNNVRILPNRSDTLLPPELDDEEDEEVDLADEEDDEEEQSLVEKKSSSLASVSYSGKHDRRTSSSNTVNTFTSSPTLPQPPVQSSAVEQFAAVQPVLPGPVDMRTYSGDTSYDTDTQMSSNFDTNATSSAPKEQLHSSEFANTSLTTNTELLPDIEDVLEKEIQRYSSNPVAVVVTAISANSRTSTKNSPAVSVSPRVSSEFSKCVAAAVVTPAYASPTHFLASDPLDTGHGETPSVVLLDDDGQSRNQLKMKIKGPYSNANYIPVSTSSSNSNIANVTNHQLPPASQTAIANDVCYGGSVAATLLSTTGGGGASSSANLPRMRKKELLLQYCSNINESGNNVVTVASATGGGGAAAGDANNSAPVKSGPSYKLPKAVASMTSIPTKEDYKAVLDAAGFIEKKKRGKDKSVVYDASDISNNNAAAANSGFASNGNTAVGGGNNNNNHSVHNNNKHGARSSSIDRKYGAENQQHHRHHTDLDMPAYDNHSSTKRKSRNSGGGNGALSTATHPKLKIKIGGGAAAVVVQNSVSGGGSTSSSFEEKNLRLRPPKKRLCDSNDMQPSPAAVEQLKRECMRYGSKIRSQFNTNGDRYDGDYSDPDDDARSLGSSKQSAKDEGSRKKRKRSGANSTQKSAKRRKKQQKSSSRRDDAPKAEVVRVITNEIGGEGAPKKLIIKFSGLKPPSEPLPPPAPSTTTKTSSPPPPPSPAKPPKSSKRNRNHELDSVRTTKITPIRLKFSRSLQGYVSKPSGTEEETSFAGTATAASGGRGNGPASSSTSSNVADSSMLPNELSRTTKTAPSHSVSETSAGGVSAAAAAVASNTSVTTNTTIAAAVCVSDAS